MRKEKNGTRYFGFNEVAKEVFGLKPFENKVNNPNKQKEFQEKFEKKHVCKVCKQPLSYVGGNVLCCTNPDCKGNVSYQLMDEDTKSFAKFIYGEKG